MIRTVHGRGFRFVADVTESRPAQAIIASGSVKSSGLPSGRPSIAVLPFRPLAMAPELAILADAIPHEIIQALSRLRWLAVIARGSSFRFRQPDPDLDLVATALGARYVLSGVIEARGRSLAETLELSDSSSNEVIWGDRLTAPIDSIDDLRSRIVAHLVTALEAYIPLNEARSAQLAGLEALDAWAKLTSRAAAPVSFYGRRERAGQGSFRARGCTGPALCPRPCGPVLHQLSGRLPAPYPRCRCRDPCRPEPCGTRSGP